MHILQKIKIINPLLSQLEKRPYLSWGKKITFLIGIETDWKQKSHLSWFFKTFSFHFLQESLFLGWKSLPYIYIDIFHNYLCLTKSKCKHISWILLLVITLYMHIRYWKKEKITTAFMCKNVSTNTVISCTYNTVLVCIAIAYNAQFPLLLKIILLLVHVII